MNKNMKDVIGGVLVLVLVLVGYSAFSYSQSYGKSINPPSFSVSGEGKVAAVPDIAKFSFSVITQGGKDIGTIQKTNTEKSKAVIEFLKKEGVEEKDIKTSNYSIEPRHNFNNRPAYGVMEMGMQNDEIVGYTVNQSVEVTVRDFDKIGGLLSGVVTAGANSISSFYFTFDDPIEIRNEARKLAIEEAKRKAGLIAKAGGFRVGRLLSIDENQYYPAVYNKYGMGGADTMMMESAPAVAVEPGSEDISVNVMMRYELKD